MAYYVTARDTFASFAGDKIPIPKNTQLIHVPFNAGLKTPGYAVKHVSAVAHACHDRFRAQHYYAWIKPEDVETIQDD